MTSIVAPPQDEQPISRTYQYRKVMKPMLERKRRARINHCLDELKELLVGALQAEGESVSRLEKADVLELTVRHLHKLRRLQQYNEASASEKFKVGFISCTNEVSKYISNISNSNGGGGMDLNISSRLMSHLDHCISQIELTHNNNNNNVNVINNNNNVVLIPNNNGQSAGTLIHEQAQQAHHHLQHPHQLLLNNSSSSSSSCSPNSHVNSFNSSSSSPATVVINGSNLNILTTYTPPTSPISSPSQKQQQQQLLYRSYGQQHPQHHPHHHHHGQQMTVIQKSPSPAHLQYPSLIHPNNNSQQQTSLPLSLCTKSPKAESIMTATTKCEPMEINNNHISMEDNEEPFDLSNNVWRPW